MATFAKEEFSNRDHISKLAYANGNPELALCLEKRTLRGARGLSGYVTSGKSLSTNIWLHPIRASNKSISGELPAQKNNLST